MQDLRVIDWEEARTRIPGGEQGLQELVAMMIEECPVMLLSIKEGLAAGDTKRVRIDAHTLAGSARHFAADEVSTAAFALEAYAREADLPAAERALPDLERKLARLTSALEAGPSTRVGTQAPSGEASADRVSRGLDGPVSGRPRIEGEAL